MDGLQAGKPSNAEADPGAAEFANGIRAVSLWLRQAGWLRPNVTRKPVAEMIASLQAAPHLS